MKPYITVGLVTTLGMMVGWMARPVLAEPMGLYESYVGVGAAGALAEGGQGYDERQAAVAFQGRFAIPKASMSVRASAMVSEASTVLVPTVTLDVPVARGTNLYAGAGYSIPFKTKNASVLGNRNAAIINGGIESAVSPDLLLYGDVKWGIDAYKNSSADSVSVSAGVGFRFK